MKSFRFASVVAASGKPEVHLLLLDPSRDATLQKAIRAHRVLTIHQSRNAADYGTVGFEKGAAGQILIFPKPLKSFEGARIVGVKYELLDDAPVPSAQRYRPSKKAPPRRKGKRRASEPKTPPEDKVVHFPGPPPEEDDENTEVGDLKQGIRHAMRLLEDGREVAAFNVLKRLAT